MSFLAVRVGALIHYQLPLLVQIAVLALSSIILSFALGFLDYRKTGVGQHRFKEVLAFFVAELIIGFVSLFPAAPGAILSSSLRSDKALTLSAASSVLVTIYAVLTQFVYLSTRLPSRETRPPPRAFGWVATQLFPALDSIMDSAGRGAYLYRNMLSRRQTRWLTRLIDYYPTRAHAILAEHYRSTFLEADMLPKAQRRRITRALSRCAADATSDDVRDLCFQLAQTIQNVGHGSYFSSTTLKSIRNRYPPA